MDYIPQDTFSSKRQMTNLKTQKPKCWQNLKTQILTKLKKKQCLTKLENSNCDKTKKFNLWQKIKNQIVELWKEYVRDTNVKKSSGPLHLFNLTKTPT